MIMIILLSLLPFSSANSTNSISNEFFASTTATVNLTIASSGGFGTTTLTKGKSYTYTVKVKNNGSSSWSGAFYLKSGSTNWLDWSKTISAGSIVTLSGTYTPTTTGSHTLTLYYQTGGSGAGTAVPKGNYSNPISVTVSDPAPSLTLASSGGFNATNMTKGQSYTYTVKVKNTGSSSWSGAFYLKSGNTVWLDWSKTISAGSTVTLSGTYTPTETGSHTLTLYYQTGGTGAGTAVSKGSYSNPISVTVSEPAPSLTLASSGGFNATNMTKGQSYTYTVKVKNTGSSSWSGAFYLKSGNTVWLDWSKTISAGSTVTLSGTYTPTETGSHTLTLYYQTGGTGAGTAVSKGSYSNPISVTVSEPAQTVSLTLASSGGFNATTLTKGQSYTYTVKVKNTGSSSWSGAFYLKSGSTNWLSWSRTISAGSTVTLTDTYTPTVTGSHTLTLYYQTGGAGAGVVVPKGSYNNPISVTVSENTTKLATPDKNTFSATDVTYSSFIARWGAVSGATKYNINIREVGKEYVNSGISTSQTYWKFSGLSPNTSYQFQVQAVNGNKDQNSDWSASIPTAVKTAFKENTPANLSIVKVTGFTNTSTFYVNKSNVYRVFVQNNGTSDWQGSFYLKDGSSVIGKWENKYISGKTTSNPNPGVELPCNYVPTASGSKSLVLYYQTSGESALNSVNASNSSWNPMTITVKPDPSANPSLSLKTAISATSTLELGKTATVSVQVQNTGTSDWYGTVILTDNGIIIGSVENLPKQQYKTISANWKPTTAGQHTIAVYSVAQNTSTRQVVSANGFTNPITVMVSNAASSDEVASVVVKHITAEVEPKEVTPGTVILYHYRLLNENGKPLNNVRLRFRYNHNNQTKYIESIPSDIEGYSMLCVATSGSEAIAGRGETVILYCTQAINENNKAIPVAGSEADKNITLKIHQANQFVQDSGIENVEKVKLTITPGVTGKVSKTVSPSSFLGSLAKSKVSLGFPIGLGLKWDDNGNISEYSLSLGAKITGAYKAAKDKEKMKEYEKYVPSINASVSGGYKVNFSTSNPKEAVIHFIKGWIDNYNGDVDWKTDLAVKAMRHWFEDRDEGNLKIDQYAYYTYGAGVSGDIFKNLPGGKEIKQAFEPGLSIESLKVGGSGSVTIEPWKTKYDSSTGKSLEGYSSSVKLGGEFDFKGKVHDLVNLIQADKMGLSAMDAYNLEVLSDKFFYENFGLKYSSDFSMKHEEMYNKDSNDLEEVSQQMSLSSSWDFSLENMQIGDILTDGWGPIDLSLGYTSKYTSKVSSKGKWARFLRRQVISENDYQSEVMKVFPNLSYKTYFAPPYKIYSTWQKSFDAPLSILAGITPAPSTYSLKDALKVERTVSSEFDGSVSIKVYDFGWCNLYFDTDLNVELENRPNESYFSIPDRRTFDVVFRPTTSIKKVAASAIKHTANTIYEAFIEEHPNIEKAWNWMMQACGLVVDATGEIVKAVDNTIGDFFEDKIFYPFFYHWYMKDRTNVNARIAMARHSLLSDTEQNDICKLGFGINNDIQNFDTGVKISIPHHYPAGDLLGITDQGDTLFVVSEVCDLIAIQGNDTLKTAQHGEFSVIGVPGADDLTPFGFREDQALDVYYSEEGSKIWHYVGPAGTVLKTNKLGAYMMATSIKNDVVKPEIISDFDNQSGIIHISITENIGLKLNTLNVMLNGEARDFTMINESNFEIELTAEDMQYMINLNVSVYDLAGNMGTLTQVYQLDKPEKVNIKNLPDTDISQLENTIYIGNVSAEKGKDMTLSVKMKNSVVAEGFQFDLELPEGVTVAKDADGFAEAYLSTERTTTRKTNTFDADFQDNGALRVMAGSTNGSTISGNDGEVAIIKLNVASDVKEGTYPIVLRNISISDSNAQSHDVDLVKSTLTVTGVLGDVDGDGYVTKADVTALADYIMGRNPESFNYNNANINGDFNVDVADLVLLLNMVK
jgi:hypothetical protein